VDEWEDLRNRLTTAGVTGAEDLGRFVSNPRVLGASTFDERAAMPILIDALPSLTDARLVKAVAGHLRRSWARPAAFDALYQAFLVWAPEDPMTGWQLGDALGTTANVGQVEQLIEISMDRRYGMARQMVLLSLSRFSKSPGVAEVARSLIDDPDVALHAMKTYAKAVGQQAALSYIEGVERDHRGTQIGDQATREARKIRKRLGIN
jgi:hypothetical protein